MATKFYLYNSFLKYRLDGTIDLKNDTIKVALVTSDYTPTATHDVLADVTASPSPEVEQEDSPDNGYTTGGEEITGKAFNLTDSPALCAFDADDLTWSSLTATFRYGIMYAAVTRNSVTNPLIGWILFDDAPADIEVSGVNFTLYWNADGILTMENAE